LVLDGHHHHALQTTTNGGGGGGSTPLSSAAAVKKETPTAILISAGVTPDDGCADGAWKGWTTLSSRSGSRTGAGGINVLSNTRPLLEFIAVEETDHTGGDSGVCIPVLCQPKGHPHHCSREGECTYNTGFNDEISSSSSSTSAALLPVCLPVLCVTCPGNTGACKYAVPSSRLFAQKLLTKLPTTPILLTVAAPTASSADGIQRANEMVCKTNKRPLKLKHFFYVVFSPLIYLARIAILFFKYLILSEQLLLRLLLWISSTDH
jgi:hypothetical protein